MSHLPERSGRWTPWVALAAMMLAMVVQLLIQDRIWWCACGGWKLWDGDIWSAHNSQHLFDPYSFTHALHGVIFCGLIVWFLWRVPRAWYLTIACGIEAAWEVFENTPFVIQRYREATIGQGYEGDSILNSLADVLCCALGFLLARRIGWKWSLVVFAITELALLFWVRDNLTLNVLMLLCPVEAIKAWQMAH